MPRENAESEAQIHTSIVSALKQLWPRKVAAAPAGTPAATAASA